MVWMLYLSCALLILVVVWAMFLHHRAEVEVEAWRSTWNTAVELCCWRTPTGLCLQPPESIDHLTPDDVRDPRRSVTQTSKQHPFAPARLIDRYAGLDPTLAALSRAVTPAGVSHAEQAIEVTDAVLAMFGIVADWVRGISGRVADWRRERRARAVRMGLREDSE